MHLRCLLQLNIKFFREQKKMKKQRRSWTQKQDILLESLVQKYNTNSWKQIAAQLTNLSESILSRNPRQCRQRWQNCLSPLNKKQWKQDQQLLLLSLFEQYHTKWTKISSFMEQRNQFSVKSHFYSITRKCIRKLSKFMQEHKNIYRHVKSIPQAAVSKLFSLWGSHYQKKFEIQDDISIELVQGTVKLLLQFIKNELSWQHDRVHQLIKNLLFFSRNCRRRKKKRNILEDMKADEVAEMKNQKNFYSKAQKKRRLQLWKKNVKVFPKSKTLPQIFDNASEKQVIKEQIIESISQYDSKRDIQNALMKKSLSSQMNEEKNQKFLSNLKISSSKFVPVKIEEPSNHLQLINSEDQFRMMQLQYLNILAFQQSNFINSQFYY